MVRDEFSNFEDDYKISRKPNKKKSNKLIIFILLLGIILVIYSSINLYKWYIDSVHMKKSLININENVTIDEINKNGAKLIDVDFSKLKDINPDIIGWIQVPGTNVNYPFVQSTDNDYYLTNSFDKSFNNAGWVFLDYRNDTSLINKNSIIYAHSRLDGSMFGSLKNVLNSNWFDNTSNHIIKISTENENTLWQIFSVYKTPLVNDYLKIDFNSDDEFKVFADTLKNRSDYDFNTTVDSSDKILTLSTCHRYNGNERLLIHAKLVEI